MSYPISEDELVDKINKLLSRRLREAVTGVEVKVEQKPLRRIIVVIDYADDVSTAKHASGRLGPGERINFLEGFLACLEVIEEVF
jgi:hypothetical protein